MSSQIPNPQELIRFWAPCVIGVMASHPLYGLAVAQTIFYYRTYPHDARFLKLVVALLLLLNTAHFVILTQQQLVAHFQVKFMDISALTPNMSTGFISYAITSIVQWSYAKRVWILSGGNRVLTGILIILPIIQFGSGMGVGVTQTLATIHNKFTPHDETCTILCSIEALASIICDLIISASVAYYLAKMRKGFPRSENLLQQLVFYTISTGLVTSVAALGMSVVWFLFPQGTVFLTLQLIVTRVYVNALLASLNARVDFEKQSDWNSDMNGFEELHGVESIIVQRYNPKNG